MNGIARRASVLAAAGLLLAGCSLDYEASQLASEISEDIPDTVLFEVKNTIVRDGAPRFLVEAQRAETFSRLDRQYLYEIRFQELDREGSVITDGVADYAEYQTDTEDFELTGALRFYSAREEAWLSADYLYWDSDARLLTSEPEEPVIVERADGTTIRGRGFVAEMGRSIIRFEGGVSGTLVEDENPE